MGVPITARVPAVTAGSAFSQPLEVEEDRSTGAAAVLRGHFVPDTDQAAEGTTDFATLQLRRLRGGSAVATLGAIPFSTVACVAETPIDFAVTDAAAADGDVLEVHAVHTGTGGAIPAGVVEVELA